MFRECTALQSVDFGSSLTAIPAYAFYNTKLSKIDLPDSVKSIDIYAFYNNSSATSVNLGNSLTSIGDNAFYNLGTQQTVLLPSTLKTIGTNAFMYSGLREIVIPASVTSVGSSCFENSTVLSKVSIAGGVSTIPASMFSGCTSLSDITLSDGLKIISNKAFSGCTALASISIPGTVTQIGTTTSTVSSLPFYNCTSLSSVRFEDGSSDLSLGAYFVTSSSSKGLFYCCPLSEVYLGRNIKYDNINSSYTFSSYPEYYGYSAFYNQSKLAKVTIGEGATALTDYLFYKNGAITLLTLPKVKTIGKSTFEVCSKLATLNLGDSITNIGECAFYNCSALTKLTFPDAIQTIGASAFYNCNSITEVTVGKDLKSIGSSAFYNCKSLTALVLPDGFTTMGDNAFENCIKLTVAKLGKSLTAVPSAAFKNCISLSDMTIPATATSIGSQAFYNDSALAKITMQEGLKTIGSEVFYNNKGIMNFTIPGTVSSIGQNSFYGCTNVTYLIFSDGDGELVIDNSNTKSSIVDKATTNTAYRNRKYDYFYDCPIRFLTIGKNIKYSYSGEVEIYNIDDKKYEYRASSPFAHKSTIRSIKVGSKVTYLYHHLANNCDGVSSISFPESLKYIYSYAFSNCDAISSVSFPSGLVKLDDAAFYNCPKLADVVFVDKLNTEPELTIGASVFASDDKIVTLTFPGRLKSIGNNCFNGCLRLDSVVFNDSRKAVTLGYDNTVTNGEPLFSDCKLKSLYMGRNIDYSVPSTVTSSGYSPFSKQARLTNVKFSQAGTVTYCRDYLLYKVNHCDTLELPNSLTSIGNYTFSGMSELKGISIPDNVTEIGTYAFSNDTVMKSAKLSRSCPWLKTGLFSGCNNLDSIRIPAVVTKMDSYMFKNCSSLSDVYFEGSAEMLEMGYGASNDNYGLFGDCPVETLYLDRWILYNTDSSTRAPFCNIAALKNLHIGSNVKVIDKYMFSYCTGLENVTMPDNIESVGLCGFRGCTSLKNVTFSNNTSQIGDYAFSGCTSLDNVVFPASLTSIADNSFSNCTSLRSLDMGESLMIIGPAAFKNCTALNGIVIPETLYGLGVEAFANCTSLPNVTIRGISSVSKQAFENCTGLKWVSLSDNISSLGENAFKGCTGLKYVKSYAEFPPEGLVNFPEEVVANGTLFVPEYSIDYYMYSPTWEYWSSFRALTENIMVEAINLDYSEHEFKASETIQLIATIANDDATDKTIIWKSSDESVVTVDTDGVVTAVAVGEAFVEAIAADGSGQKSICNFVVNPTMVESISIVGDVDLLKKGRTIQLVANVLPLTSTNATVEWTTSDPDKATVSASGEICAIATGDVIITATATDGSGIRNSFALTVIPPTKGDSNDNDEVTISDAVNTANYAIGNEVLNFCFEAADVNEDSKVTLADASGTVNILLEQPIGTVANKASSHIRVDNDADMLIVDDFALCAGESSTINVRLDNSMDYVAMQADITLPENMKMVSVVLGERAEANHSLLVKSVDNNRVRIALFDVNNSPFCDTDDALIKICVEATSTKVGDIVISNILAADADANEYRLKSTGGHNSAFTGADSVNGENVAVKVNGNEVIICNEKDNEVTIYAVDGTLITRFIANANVVRHHLANGVYIVTVGDCVKKITVK